MKSNGEVAVIMAAGVGARMRPLTESTAKPLIPICGVPMIETIINALNKRNISKIYVVTGYKKEQFGYLESKYENVVLIENTEYSVKNNISSIKAVCDVIGDKNCFICEGDLYVSDDSVFAADFSKSCYFARFIEGYSSDWLFEMEGDRVICVKTGGSDRYNLSGVSYWLNDDVRTIFDAVHKAYEEPEHGQYLWDEIVNKVLNKMNVAIYPVTPKQIVEVDTVTELEALERELQGITVPD